MLERSIERCYRLMSERAEPKRRHDAPHFPRGSKVPVTHMGHRTATASKSPFFRAILLFFLGVLDTFFISSQRFVLGRP
jgi:hypothetical protein